MTLRFAIRVAGTFLAGVLVLVISTGASHPAVMTATDMTRFGVSSYTDMTDAAAASMPSLPVTRETAVVLAAEYLGNTEPNVRVLLARAPLVRGQADRDVWIVIFPGGTAPMDGPAGATPPTYTTTSVMFDAVTGEFVRGYMH